MHKIGIIMGSDSDLRIMRDAAQTCAQFHIPHEVTIVSAHRTPERLLDYGKTAAARGLRVIIAGAGGAAHLPGMIAAVTPLPVIGVPIHSSNSIDCFLRWEGSTCLYNRARRYSLNFDLV